MFVLGGRTNKVGETVPFEVYDTESSDWYRYASISRFRHSCWILDQNLYVHGGFEHDSPNVPTNVITKIDIAKMFSNQPALLKSLDPKLMDSKNKSSKQFPENYSNYILLISLTRSGLPAEPTKEKH